jgi:hypothetical protein
MLLQDPSSCTVTALEPVGRGGVQPMQLQVLQKLVHGAELMLFFAYMPGPSSIQ